MTNKQQIWSSIMSQLAQAGVGGNFGNKEVAAKINETILEFAEEYHKERLLLLDVSGQRELLFAFEEYWAKNNCDGENFADVVNNFLGK